ncbi:DUF2569 domain-containing protein [Marinobacter sp. JSM 1782161]|uniref:DUF2569 domain-containing protein n=1 Tax=Marinobacter sp. JSM 1782161 TaxID=2685906 RepID=UPI001402B3C1|nr:DUF2569 domain-containing protein [Marinobacter sp. JSM 1782161]
MSRDAKRHALGGWLILVGLAVLVAPVLPTLSILPLYGAIVTDGQWTALIQRMGVLHDPFRAPLLVSEIVLGGLLLLVSLFQIYLFFARHYLFPRLFRVFLMLQLLFVPLDVWVHHLTRHDGMLLSPVTLVSLTTAAVTALVWIPYMKRSRRVARTFVAWRPEDDNQPDAEAVGYR